MFVEDGMRSILRLVTDWVQLPAPADWLLTTPRVICFVLLPVKFGMGKFPPPAWFAEDIGRLGFPMPWFFAWCAVVSEVVASLLVAVGLFTRPMALLVLITMAVAAFVQKGNAPLWEKLPSLFFFQAAWFALVLGGGRLSLDHLVRRWLSRSGRPIG